MGLAVAADSDDLVRSWLLFFCRGKGVELGDLDQISDPVTSSYQNLRPPTSPSRRGSVRLMTQHTKRNWRQSIASPRKEGATNTQVGSQNTVSRSFCRPGIPPMRGCQSSAGLVVATGQRVLRCNRKDGRNHLLRVSGVARIYWAWNGPRVGC